MDRNAIEAMGSLAGSNRPLIVTSGTAAPEGLAWARKTMRPIPNPPCTPPRRTVPALSMAERGAWAMVLRLPPSVHGDGDHGFVPGLINIARAKGVSAHVGDGSNCWPRRAPAGRREALPAFAGEGCSGNSLSWGRRGGRSDSDIAEMIGRRLNLPVVSVSPEEAGDHFYGSATSSPSRTRRRVS